MENHHFVGGKSTLKGDVLNSFGSMFTRPGTCAVFMLGFFLDPEIDYNKC